MARPQRADPPRAGDSALRTEPALDRLLDQIASEQRDWRRWVERYPKSTLTLAALGGFVLGSTRGREVLSSLGSFAADALTEAVNEFLGRDVI